MITINTKKGLISFNESESFVFITKLISNDKSFESVMGLVTDIHRYAKSVNKEICLAHLDTNLETEAYNRLLIDSKLISQIIDVGSFIEESGATITAEHEGYKMSVTTKEKE